MLDNQTKKIIDDARDILVGKIPAPNTQVDQITLAMLYKFMDDIDQESIEFGGNPLYFTGDYKKYSWRDIMRKSVSAQNRMNLYIEALEKFYTHPGLPKTFKDIFKNANVPYRDPEVLSLFLRSIDLLHYDDSETLGDAYEYLLSILGSQGGLGQFRTPRHIIDFIVKVINPKKDETILDPACGTAGFLISAYKHIISNNQNSLNYDEKIKILDNITGYDIEPSMVKIAEMNMYLHGCTTPDIYEYDSLTSEDKWEERFDVILANPPFMTPKGGIKPHSRFSIQSSRSEILFIDYILNHLKRDGRAGIIVPDGIVSNNSSSYQKIRELAMKSGLYAIVSLPVGVFNPYSVVKTSILLFDKSIRNNINHILFVKIDSDGFDLGNQRGIISMDDLPFALNQIKDYREFLVSNDSSNYVIDESSNLLLAPKDKIITNGFILVSEYYKSISGKKKYPHIRLADLLKEERIRAGEAYESYDVCTISSAHGGFIKQNEFYNKDVSSNNRTNYKIVKNGWIGYRPPGLDIGTIGLQMYDEEVIVSPLYAIFSIKENLNINPIYLIKTLQSEEFKNTVKPLMVGTARPQVAPKQFLELKIPVPPIEIQDKIANSYERIIEHEQAIQSIQNEMARSINLTWSE